MLALAHVKLSFRPILVIILKMRNVVIVAVLSRTTSRLTRRRSQAVFRLYPVHSTIQRRNVLTRKKPCIKRTGLCSSSVPPTLLQPSHSFNHINKLLSTCELVVLIHIAVFTYKMIT